MDPRSHRHVPPIPPISACYCFKNCRPRASTTWEREGRGRREKKMCQATYAHIWYYWEPYGAFSMWAYSVFIHQACNQNTGILFQHKYGDQVKRNVPCVRMCLHCVSNTGANERSISRARSASSNVSLRLCKSVYYLVWTSLNETAYVCACIS